MDYGFPTVRQIPTTMRGFHTILRLLFGPPSQKARFDSSSRDVNSPAAVSHPSRTGNFAGPPGDNRASAAIPVLAASARCRCCQRALKTRAVVARSVRVIEALHWRVGRKPTMRLAEMSLLSTQMNLVRLVLPAVSFAELCVGCGGPMRRSASLANSAARWRARSVRSPSASACNRQAAPAGVSRCGADRGQDEKSSRPHSVRVSSHDVDTATSESLGSGTEVDGKAVSDRRPEGA